MSAEPLDLATVTQPEGWPASLPWDAGLWARVHERNRHLPPLTDEQLRRIAPLMRATTAAREARDLAARTTRTAS